MTCIVGYLHDGGATLAADTLASASHLAIAAEPHKLFRSGPALVGISGGLRIGQILRFRCPDLTLGVDGPLPSLLRWIEAVRPILREAGVLRVKDGVEELTDSRLLVALDGRLFEVDSEWQAVEPRRPYWAIGSGQPFALGAFAAIDRVMGLTPKERLLRVLGIVEKFDPHVGPPFETISTAK